MRGGTKLLFSCLILKGEEEDDLLKIFGGFLGLFGGFFFFLWPLCSLRFTDSDYHFGIFKPFF